MKKRKAWLPPLLAFCGVVAAIGLLAVILHANRPDTEKPRKERTAEELAGMLPSERAGGRYYIPSRFHSNRDGEASLTYKVRGTPDSSVTDFWRTYALPGSPPSKAKTLMHDTYKGKKRTIGVAYGRSGVGDTAQSAGVEPDKDLPAVITVDVS